MFLYNSIEIIIIILKLALSLSFVLACIKGGAQYSNLYRMSLIGGYPYISYYIHNVFRHHLYDNLLCYELYLFSTFYVIMQVLGLPHHEEDCWYGVYTMLLCDPRLQIWRMMSIYPSHSNIITTSSQIQSNPLHNHVISLRIVCFSYEVYTFLFRICCKYIT